VNLDNLYFLKAVDRLATVVVHDRLYQTGDNIEYFWKIFKGGLKYRRDEGGITTNW